MVWLRSTIESEREQKKQLAIGWAREIWIFVNGSQVAAAKNLYDPEAARKFPDGRLAISNGSFTLPLRKGSNELAIALDDDFPGGLAHYGWGLQARLDDVDGITLPDER